MIGFVNNALLESKSPHSLGLSMSVTTPAEGFDNSLIAINQKRNWGAGLSGLSFDGTGLLGTGLFSGDVTTWGWSELIAGLVAGYAIYAMFFQAKQTKYRMEASAGRRRKSRAKGLREKAKKLEEQTEGIF